MKNSKRNNAPKTVENRLHKYFLYGLIIFLIFFLAIGIRFTSLLRIFCINWWSAFIVKNWFWALFIGILLVTAGIVEHIQLERNREKEKEEDHE